MLLTIARRPARFDERATSCRSTSRTARAGTPALIAEGVETLQGALARDRRGPFQLEAAIAALHDDAASADETDWPQILEWYDELLALGDNPVVRLNRAVAVGQVDGPHAGLRALDGLPADLPRLDAVRAHLHERAGEFDLAMRHYDRAADITTSSAERTHLTSAGPAATDLSRRWTARGRPRPGWP